MQHKDELAKYQEELEKLRKENHDLNDGRLSPNSMDTCSLLLENYKKIRDQNCDLTLELAGEKTLSVHKTILMGKLIISDPLYKSLIFFIYFPAHSSKLAEIFSTAVPSILNLPEFTHEIMEKVVSFLYSGRLDGATEDVPALLKVAGKLKIAVLKNYLMKNAKDLLNVQNFLAYYVAAKEENCKELKTQALKFFTG